MKPLKPRNTDWKDKNASHLRNFKYGRTYYIAFQGVTEGIEFTLKKKKVIPCKWNDGKITYERLTWLRSILNQGFIHFSFEVDTSIEEVMDHTDETDNSHGKGMPNETERA